MGFLIARPSFFRRTSRRPAEDHYPAKQWWDLFILMSFDVHRHAADVMRDVEFNPVRVRLAESAFDHYWPSVRAQRGLETPTPRPQRLASPLLTATIDRGAWAGISATISMTALVNAPLVYPGSLKYPVRRA